MRVLIVNSFYYPDMVGGAEHSVKKLAEELSKKGNEVFVLTTGSQSDKEFINGINVIRTKCKNVFSYKEYRNKNICLKAIFKVLDINNFFAYNSYKKIIKDISPDIIHTNNLYGISPIIWKIGKDLKVPIVHTLRDYYLLCSKSTLIKNNEDCTQISSKCKIYRELNEKLSRYVQVVTAPSKAVISIFESNGYFKNAKKVSIENAIDFDFQETLKIKKDKDTRDLNVIKFVFLGNLVEYKGIKLLVDTFKEIKNKELRLFIAGSGELEGYINEAAKNDSRITFCGKLQEKEVNLLLRDSDVLIAPSIWKEPFGRVVLDAHKAAMPAIVSKIGGLEDIIKHEQTGYLVRPANKADLEDAIMYFSDRKNIKSSLDACVQNLQKYNIEEHTNKYLSVYRSLTYNYEKIKK